MSGSNVSGRRSRPRKTEGKSGKGRTTFAYRFDFHGLKFEADDAFGGLSSSDDQWFRTTFVVYCGELADRARVTARIEGDIEGSSLEAIHKKVLSDEMEAAAEALLRGESYETPEGGRQLARLKVSPALTSGRMTNTGVRDTLPGVPNIDPNKSTRARTDPDADVPTADRGARVERGPDESGLGELRLPSPLSSKARQALSTIVTKLGEHPELAPLVRARCDEVMISQTESVRVVPPVVAHGPKGRGVSGEKVPLAREGHPIIEKLTALWDEREALARQEFVRRYQQILDRFHETKSLGSYESNLVATRWVNRLASKNSIKLLFNGEAVTIYCSDRGESGLFVPRQAKGRTAAIKGASSYAFPSLTAMPH